MKIKRKYRKHRKDKKIHKVSSICGCFNLMKNDSYKEIKNSERKKKCKNRNHKDNCRLNINFVTMIVDKHEKFPSHIKRNSNHLSLYRKKNSNYYYQKIHQSFIVKSQSI
ncbi:hypothetical protein BpHYR1_026998 [Brachionus plicatilis]|uniref:Uncharacterized protein n=1 Tax=Brachionus plicatilis TaxID=10195 RepID=A0A3M7SP78_BRAPC|nr:hypothetical protein BpHYR1_026998 [Brachionus plicatilis]